MEVGSGISQGTGLMLYSQCRVGDPLHFFSTKKNPAAAGDVEGLMYPCWRASWMYSSIDFCSVTESG